MASSVLLPQVENLPFGARLNRWAARWSLGGIEPYILHPPTVARLPLERGLAGSIEVSLHRIRLAGLPDSFRGFRIVQVSDIHHGLYFPLRAVAEAIELANSLDADLVALTGDFVTYSRAYIEPVAALLGQLRARYGLYAVLGNHDFRVGADELERGLRHQGIEVLRNRNTTLYRRGESVCLAGVDDYGYGADVDRALQGVSPDAPTILLAHNPRLVPAAARHGVGLVLSGHTHGGQVHLPVVGNVYGRRPDQLRFKRGWGKLGATQVYVSRGVGTVVLPFRLNCPAEIPHLELQPELAA